MQEIVSTTVSAERWHLLLHSHLSGSRLGVRQAAHLQRPQSLQMIESEEESSEGKEEELDSGKEKSDKPPWLLVGEEEEEKSEEGFFRVDT